MDGLKVRKYNEALDRAQRRTRCMDPVVRTQTWWLWWVYRTVSTVPHRSNGTVHSYRVSSHTFLLHLPSVWGPKADLYKWRGVFSKHSLQIL